MFLLLNSNDLQGLTHVNKAVYVCRRLVKVEKKVN